MFHFDNVCLYLGENVKENLVYTKDNTSWLLLGNAINPMPLVPNVDVIRNRLIEGGKLPGNIKIELNSKNNYNYFSEAGKQIINGKSLRAIALLFNEDITAYHVSVRSERVVNFNIREYRGDGEYTCELIWINAFFKHKDKLIEKLDTQEHKDGFMSDVYEGEFGYISSLIEFTLIDRKGHVNPKGVETLMKIAKESKK